MIDTGGSGVPTYGHSNGESEAIAKTWRSLGKQIKSRGNYGGLFGSSEFSRYTGQTPH